MQTRKPKWWQLFLPAPIMIGLLVLARVYPLSPFSTPAVAAAIALISFGWVLAWAHLNGGLIERYYTERNKTRTKLDIIIKGSAPSRATDSYDSSNVTPPGGGWGYWPHRVLAGRRGEPEENDKWPLN